MSETYYIKNKDSVLGAFQWKTQGGIDTPTLVEDLGLPGFISQNLTFWVKTRRPPKHRRHIEQLLQACGFTSTRDIINASLGLSLTDCLWITQNAGQSWASVNLYDNPFNEVIAQIAFTGGSQPLRFSTTSPEFCTDGMLSKCWVREPAGICLKKADTGKALTVYAEVLASQVCDVLGVPHVEYSLDTHHGKLCCSCKLLTSQAVMMVPSYLYYDYETPAELQAQLERDGLLRDYGNMLLADYVIKNIDRHPGNIGVLLNAETFELIGLPKLYDNGQSFFFPGPPAMYDSWAEQLAVLRDLGQDTEQASTRLMGFSFHVEKTPGLEAEDLDKAYETIADSIAELHC